MNTLPKTLGAFYWHFIKKHPYAYAFLFASPMAIILEANIMPYALKLIIDGITNFDGNKDEIFTVIASPITLYFSAWITMVIIFRTQHWVHVWLVPTFNADIRMTVFNYVKYHSHTYFSDHFAGSIANKIGDLPRSTITLFQSVRWQVVTTLSVIIASLIVAATVNLTFTVIIFCWVIAHMGVAYYFAKRINHYSKIYAENLSTVAGKIVDVLSNISNLRLFARGDYEGQYINTYQEISRKSFQKTELEFWKLALAFEIPTISMFATIFYFLVIGWQQGWVSAGDFVLIVFISSGVLRHTWQLGMELANIFKEIGICQQALALVNHPHGVVDKTDAKPLTVTKGKIMFDDVNFHYIPARDIFSGKNITIEAGEKVGLVGFSGSGKSTFVNLILRFYDVESGQIRIDGQNVADVTQDSLREHISMIPQDTTLFHRSLMENIRYGRLDATDEEVIQASKQAHCHEFIEEIPEGYGALVGERGIKLSGGQRQRIAVARAILKDAPILILDEATSSLDSITEKYIQESLQKLMKHRTTIVIAHRLSTLSNMDRILVFKDGEIIEDGSHETLLRQKGHYTTLWDMQAGGFLPEL